MIDYPKQRGNVMVVVVVESEVTVTQPHTTLPFFCSPRALLHMPGPRNQKKQRGTEAKKSRKKGTSKSLVAASLAYAEVVDIPAVVAVDTPEPVRAHDVSYVALSLNTAYVSIVGPNDASNAAEPTSKCIASHPPRLSPAPPVPPSPLAHDAVPFPAPCIEDPGSGPRVRDAVAFLASPWAIRPATLDEAPLCAELAEEDVLAMVREILPEELAVVRISSFLVPGALTEKLGRWCGITARDAPAEYV
jgi:hypothetical protein